MKAGRRILLAMAALLSAGAYLLLAYATPRASFGQLLGLFAGAGAGYVLLVRGGLPLRAGLGLGLLLRLLWLPATPAFSDDFYRFRWDGLLVAHGRNPFQHRPDALVAAPGLPAPAVSTPPRLARALQELYPRLNSPHYYSVYPPVCQAVFGLAAGLFPWSETGFVIILRLVILAAEAGSAWLLVALLASFNQPRERTLLYLLHPLAIIELAGNLHFEALVIFFVLLAFWLLSRKRWPYSAAALGLAVATKLVPLLALPLLGKRLGWKHFAAYSLVLGGLLTLLFSPFISQELIENISRSLRLYFHNFEFNASLYYVLRAIGYRLSGYNEIALIGPALAGTAALATLLWAGREKQPTLQQFPATLLFMLSTYYLCATTVHPWYLTPLMMLSVFTSFRYPLVWGGLAVLSYSAYSNATYTENPWLIGLEYGGTGALLLYEIRRSKRTAQPAL